MKKLTLFSGAVTYLCLLALGIQASLPAARAEGEQYAYPEAPVEAGQQQQTDLSEIDPHAASKLKQVIDSKLLKEQAQGKSAAEKDQMIEIGKPGDQLSLPVQNSAELQPQELGNEGELSEAIEKKDGRQVEEKIKEERVEAAPAATPKTIPVAKKKGLHRKLWFVTAELMGAQIAAVALMSALPKDVTLWGKPDIRNIFANFTSPPHFDSDRWAFNYLAHPYVGAEYYLLARNRNATWWQSLLYSAAMSLFWEGVTEGVYEKWSYQDLLITPIAGAVLGELRYQARQALVDPKTGKANTTFKKVLVVILDPVEALTGGGV